MGAQGYNKLALVTIFWALTVAIQDIILDIWISPIDAP